MLQERFIKCMGISACEFRCCEGFRTPALCVRRHRDGPVAALSFKVAVDDPRRFARSRTVGAHFGLTPRRHQSGTSIDYEGRISSSNEANFADHSEWLGNLDSNQDKQSQSLLCYRYTIPQ